MVNGGDGWVIPTDRLMPTLVFLTGAWTITIGYGMGLGPMVAEEELIRWAAGISIVES